MSKLLDDAVRTGINNDPDSLRIRAFSGNAFDYRVTSALTFSQMSSSETICEWLDRVAGDPAVCFAINGLSAWSLSLSRWARGAIACLIPDACVAQHANADVYTFVGNSGWTPFGIHRDSEPSLIFHLGPADKEVWVWPEGCLDDGEGFWRNPSFGSPLGFDVEKHLPSAWHAVLKPGDFVCIPRGAYHVFRNLGPATFIGIALYPLEGDKFIRDTINRAVLGAAGAEGSLDSLTQTFEKALGRFDTIAELGRSTQAEMDRSLVMRRTTGYQDELKGPAIARRTLDDSRRLRWEFEGVVEASDITGSTELIIRGRSIKFTRTLDFGALCRMSAVEGDFGYADLLGAMPPELPGRDRSAVAQRLYDYGAISLS